MKREVILEACRNLGELLFKKNQAYGSSFAKSGQILEILFDGEPIPPKMFTQTLLMVRVLDKLSRLAKDADAFGESPWGDIAGYGIIGLIMSGKHPPVAVTESEPAPPAQDINVRDLGHKYDHLRHVVWSVLSEMKYAKTVDQVFADEHIQALRRHAVSPDQPDPLPSVVAMGGRFA
jgi:hypothetical protein